MGLFTTVANVTGVWATGSTAGGTVTLYEEVNHHGDTHKFEFTRTQRCYNFNCYNMKVMSATWEALPTIGSFDGKARIAFYADSDCGNYRRYWSTDVQKTGKFPTDFTYNFGVNHQVSSVMLLKESDQVESVVDAPCT